MMKRLFVGLLTVTLLASVGIAQAVDGDYFPLTVGTQWVYGGNPQEIALVAKVTNVERSIYGPVYVWAGFQGKRLIRVADDGKILDLQGDTWRVFLDLNAAEGTSWTIEAVEGADDILNNATVTVASRNETVTVPYGAFRQTVHLKIKTPLGARIGVTDAWFADGVGLVKWSELGSAGTQSYELTQFGVQTDPVVVDGGSGGTVDSGPIPVEPDGGIGDGATPIAVGEPCPLPFPVGQYFPTWQGLTWNYAGSPRESAPMIRMLEVQETDLGPVYLWSGFQGDHWVQYRYDNTVWEYGDGAWRLLFNFDAKEGETWTIDASKEGDLLGGSVVTVVSREEKKGTPYGGYATIHFGVHNAQLADAGVTDLWFAEGVGLVAWSETTFAGPQNYDLTSFINRNEPPIVYPGLPLDLFPTRVGLAWAYAGSPLKTFREVQLVGVERSLIPRTFVWDGLQGKRHIRKDADGKVYEIVDGGERLLLDLNAEEGTSWTIDGLDGDLLNGSVFTVISRSEKLDVSFGSFENVLHLGVKPNPQLADAGLGEVWFAPGVGLVKWTEMTIAGPQTYALVKYSGLDIDPPIVIEPPFEPKRPLEDYENRTGGETNGVRYELGTVQSAYAQGDVIEMQYRVTAVDGDVTFQFPSTQQYDFVLDNANGETVWTWSATRLFGKMLGELTLKQGESRSFVDYLNLDYEVVPSGEYTLRGWMPTNTTSEETYVKVPVTITGELTRGSLVGTVVDENGNLVVNASVGLERYGDGVGLVYSGDAVTSVEPAFASPISRNGTFQFYGLKTGTYGLTVRADGYALYAQNVTVGAGENTIDIRLKALDKDGYTNVNATRSKRFVTELATDRQLYAPGDSVQVRYRITNISEEALTLTFPSGQEYDLTLDGSNGRTWTWSETRSFIQVISSRTLPAGESITIEDAFVLGTWAKNSPSFLMTGFLTIAAQAEGEVSREETEAVVKFAIDGWMVPEPGPLVASLRTDREFYQQGDTLNVSYHLTNVSDEPVTLSFNSGQRYDLVLNGSDGPVWGWSWTRLFTAEAGELVLAPRDTFAFDETIYLDALPEAKDGAYVLRVYMTATGADGTRDQDDTEAKTRFWLGNRPVIGPPLPPIDPTQSGRLAVHLNADFQADSVQVTYRVVNVSGESLQLMFRSGQVYDLVFEGANGELWRWSDGRGFTDALQEQKLVAGDSLVVQTSFARPKLGDGVYDLRGYLTVTADHVGAVSLSETQTTVHLSVRSGEVLRFEAQPGMVTDSNKGPFRAGDFDGDGVINFGDFLRFAAAFGQRSEMASFDASADLDGNGEVDFNDFLSFAASYGR